MSMFFDLVEEVKEIFMDDFSVYGSSCKNCQEIFNILTRDIHFLRVVTFSPESRHWNLESRHYSIRVATMTSNINKQSRDIKTQSHNSNKQHHNRVVTLFLQSHDIV